VKFPVLLDADASVTTQWSVVGLPTTFVVDPKGHLAYQAVGERQWNSPTILDQVRGLGKGSQSARAAE
jgi:peroxiredoxin